MIFSVKNNSSGIAIFPAGREGHIFMETGVPYVPYRHKRRRPISMCVHEQRLSALAQSILYTLYSTAHTNAKWKI
jgi:hypothetical protein